MRTAFGSVFLTLIACGPSGTKSVSEVTPPSTTDSDAGLLDDAGVPPDAGDPVSVAPEPIPDRELVAGTRLSPRFTTVGDATVFQGWYDTELGVPCRFMPTRAGERCVPDEPRLRVFYRDADCREPVLALDPVEYWPPSTEAPRYTYEYEGNICVGGVSRVYVRGPALAAAPDSVYSLGQDGCFLDSAVGVTWFSSGGTVDLEGLVAATGLRRAGDGRLRAAYREALDGSLERVGWYDAELEQDCAPLHDERGQLRCGPREPAYMFGARYVDASCTETATLIFPGCGGSAFARESIDAPECSASWTRLWHLDEQLSPYVYQGTTTGQCVHDVTVVDRFQVWRVTPLDGADFPGMLEPMGSGRIRPRLQGAPGLPDFVAEYDRFSLEDVATGQACRLAHAADGTWRCLPSSNWSGHFKDALCTVPVHRLWSTECLVDTHVRRTDDMHLTHVLAIGVAVDANTELYQQTGASCVAAGAAGTDVRELSEVSPAEFAEATLD